MAFVSFQNVSKVYKTGEVTIEALHDVNFEIEKFGDFDMPLDLEELNQDISMRYKRLVNRFLKEEKAYIKENNIDISDFDCKGQLKTNVC